VLTLFAGAFLQPSPAAAAAAASVDQGFEIHYATNFLGHFALTQHLLPALLPQKARVVVVSSILHSYAGEGLFQTQF
jgi:NAD(P)-dependent dehydrogenase (short-subunit alcohol dehydrogenase family)